MRNAAEIAPLSNDSTIRGHVIIELPDSILVEKADESRETLRARYEPATVFLNQTPFHYTSTTDRATLTGRLFSDGLTIEMRRIDPGFLLTHRGFHWINERPFNQ